MVVAQLIEQSLPTLEIRGSNPVIGNFIYYLSTVFKTKIKNKEAENGRIKKLESGLMRE